MLRPHQHFMAAVVAAFTKVKSSSVSCHILWAELVDVQQRMNHVLFPPPDAPVGGLLAVTGMAMPTGQQQEPPGPKKGVMRRACANLGIIKASTPQVQTDTVDAV